MKCCFCRSDAEYVFLGLSLCEKCMVDLRSLPIGLIYEPEPKISEPKKAVPPKEPAPPIKPSTSLIAEIKTALDKEKFDVNRLKFEETEKTVVITPRAWLQDDWAIVNQIVKDFKGQWIRDGQQSRWEIKKS